MKQLVHVECKYNYKVDLIFREWNSNHEIHCTIYYGYVSIEITF